MIRLRDGQAEAVIDAALGAGVFALSFGGMAVLSTGTGRGPGVFGQGMNLLVPFSNRISQGFGFGGAVHDVPANLEGEAYPIHGDGFQRVWEVVGQGSSWVELRLAGGIGPFVYEARVRYVLQEDGLEVRLQVVNRAAVTLPYGGGFHPWFERHRSSRVQFRAGGYWPEDGQHLPATRVPVPVPEELRFEEGAALPGGWVNCGFAGWDGVAVIHQPDLTITLNAPQMGTLILYSPNGEAPFMCLEPVSHPVDAHNLPGQPGLVVLAPGAGFAMAMRIGWHIRGERQA